MEPWTAKFRGAMTLLILLLSVPMVSAESVAPARLLEQIEDHTAPPILDVRSASEYTHDRVPGAHHAPFTDVTARAKALHLDPHAPVVIYCEHGPRAWMARMALRWAGFTEVRLLEGHMLGWRQQGLRTESGMPH
jgi:rhodanese-related sulfurtransferase